MDTATTNAVRAAPWNKGRLVGQKPPLKLKEIWGHRLELAVQRQWSLNAGYLIVDCRNSTEAV